MATYNNTDQTIEAREITLKLIKHNGLIVERISLNKSVIMIARPQKVKPIIISTDLDAQSLIDNCEVDL